MGIRRKFTEENLSELRALVSTKSDSNMIDRARAIILLQEKATSEKIKKTTGYEREVAIKFRRRYLMGGVEALASVRDLKPVGFLEELHISANEETDPKVSRKLRSIILLEEDATPQTIKAVTGYQRAVAARFKVIYLKEGISGLRRKKERKRQDGLLTVGQQDELQQILRSSNPCDHGYGDHQFWVPKITADFIEKRYNVRFKSMTSIRDILAKTDFFLGCR